MTLSVRIKNIYGNELVYPVCDKAHLMIDLMNVKTFMPHHIRTLKDLGYIIQVETINL